MSLFSQIRSILGKSENESSSADDAGASLPSAAPPEPVERRSRKRLYSHKGRRVLIIDDSPTIVVALRRILRSAGCLTMEAADAETGLELLRKEKPELVFLDIVLPGMNGFAALRLIRRDPLAMHIPVIMISGNEQATEEFYVKRIGADDFMKKPFSRHEVFARIENLIDDNKLRLILALDEKHAPRAATRPAAAPIPAAPAAASAIAGAAASAPLSVPSPAAPTPTMSNNPAESAAVSVPAPESTAKAESAAVPIVAQTAAVSATPAGPQSASPASLSLPPTTGTPSSVPAISALEARKHLTEMGLQYFNQEQFVAAIERGDKLAVELFIAGGCVNIDA